MKAATILRAIVAMKAVDDLCCFSLAVTAEQKAHAWNELSSARNALMTELVRELPEIKIEAQS